MLSRQPDGVAQGRLYWEEFMLLRGALTAITLAALASCGQQQSAQPPAESTAAAPAAEPAPAPEAVSYDVSALEAPYNTADAAAGAKVFAKCKSCHAAGPGAPNMVGPSLHGLFGRKVGTHEGFIYSDALAKAGFEWTPARLDQYITDPRSDLPGNRMAFIGVKDPTDRKNLIAYLLIETKR
jgi:cytochrome c